MKLLLKTTITNNLLVIFQQQLIYSNRGWL